MADDPREIYLQPECCADPNVGRLWCEDDEPQKCEEGVPWTKYVVAWEYERLRADDEVTRMAYYNTCCELAAVKAERDALLALLAEAVETIELPSTVDCYRRLGDGLKQRMKDAAIGKETK